VYFVLLAAALAILVGVVAVAMGRGGEIAASQRDLPVLSPRIRSARDIARLRLPVGLFGYQDQATNEALEAAARLIAEQEAEIARLREEVWRLRSAPHEGTQADGSANGAEADAAAGTGTDAGPSGADGETVASPDPVGGQPWLNP
jgi:hypothetical protein